jgi:hypothetical protein
MASKKISQQNWENFIVKKKKICDSMIPNTKKNLKIYMMM